MIAICGFMVGTHMVGLIINVRTMTLETQQALANLQQWVCVDVCTQGLVLCQNAAATIVLATVVRSGFMGHMNRMGLVMNYEGRWQR
jgi:hypothetical protein